MDKQFGFDTRFKKGNTPWNKGIKFCSGGRSIETRFRKGNTPHNTITTGSERYSKEGYLERKIAEPNQWRSAHVILWEQHNGQPPIGHVVVFKDGNKQNIVIENLELISRSDLMKRNSVNKYPAELKNVMRMNAKLKKSIQERCVEKQN